MARLRNSFMQRRHDRKKDKRSPCTLCLGLTAALFFQLMIAAVVQVSKLVWKLKTLRLSHSPTILLSLSSCGRDWLWKGDDIQGARDSDLGSPFNRNSSPDQGIDSLVSSLVWFQQERELSFVQESHFYSNSTKRQACDSRDCF